MNAKLKLLAASISVAGMTALSGTAVAAEKITFVSWGGAYTASQVKACIEPYQAKTGQEFNIDSPKQLGPILFETLEIKARIKKTKTGQYPTGEEVLEKIKGEHPIVPAVLRYRKLKKLKSTYVDPLPKLVNGASGRVHTTYQQTVAATGRLSSKDPNLQNIPIRTEEGRAIRKAFIPRDGRLRRRRPARVLRRQHLLGHRPGFRLVEVQRRAASNHR